MTAPVIAFETPQPPAASTFVPPWPEPEEEDVRPPSSAQEADDYHGYLGATKLDAKDMQRMGKVQELKRHYRPMSALSFVSLVQGVWEYVLLSMSQGLVDGGLAGLFWTYILSFFGMGLIVTSMAEMSSMAPTSGGQYHWVSEFSPPRWQRFLSHLTGWLSTLAWQAGNASGPFVVGTLLQAIITVTYPDYQAANWQGTLIVIAVAVLVLFFNLWCSKMAPLIQNLIFTVHILGFWLIIIIFWTLSPRNTPSTVFTQFWNGGRWSSMGLALMVGQISAIFSLTASDAIAHMAEEIKDAGSTVPQTLMRSYILNGTMGAVMLVSYLFCMTSIGDALGGDTSYPLIWVLRNSVSDAMVVALISMIFVLVFAGTASLNIATTRQLWAFARDGGLPYHRWISKINPKTQVPANSAIITFVITVALSLINIGSETAFNAIISLNIVALMLTYALSIGTLLCRKLTDPNSLPKAAWSLGLWGVPINILALLYSLFAFFWCLWPNVNTFDPENMNWSFLMFCTTSVFALADYWLRGRRDFKGPVTLVSGFKQNQD